MPTLTPANTQAKIPGWVPGDCVHIKMTAVLNEQLLCVFQSHVPFWLTYRIKTSTGLFSQRGNRGLDW